MFKRIITIQYFILFALATASLYSCSPRPMIHASRQGKQYIEYAENFVSVVHESNYILLKECFLPRRFWLIDKESIKIHPNNENGDYIILNFPINPESEIRTYNEHIALAGFDEYGEWMVRNDTLILKPLSQSFFKDGDVVIQFLAEENIVEKKYTIYPRDVQKAYSNYRVPEIYLNHTVIMRHFPGGWYDFDIDKEEPTQYYKERFRLAGEDVPPAEYIVLTNNDLFLSLFSSPDK